MAEPPQDRWVLEAALREERELVLAFGGFALELAGGIAVVNERIPVPRFNFVQSVRVDRSRQSAFFERALDQYFQRALRPTFRIQQPVPPFLHETLERLGFRRETADSVLLMRAAGATLPAPDPRVVVSPAPSGELETIAQFWTGEREREEFLRALEVAMHHPNPDERLVPFRALAAGGPVAAALLHRAGPAFGIHGVATQPPARGRGAATALVAELLRSEIPPDAAPVAIWSESGRLERHLATFGFRPEARYARYGLPAVAELALPPPGPPGPPRWRPPRRGARGPVA